MQKYIFSLMLTVSLQANPSVEQMVGQLLMVHFNGMEADASAERLMKEAHVGGFIYYNWANGLTCQRQVRNLSDTLQQMAKKHDLPPLLLAADQEGGVVNRLFCGFTPFPGNGAIGRLCSPEYAEKVAHAIGEELSCVGINMNLAPVVDVNSNKDNPVIGMRSFSSDPKIVAKLGAAALKGYQRAGVFSVLKHFPGHGDTNFDTHEAFGAILKTKEQMDACDLYPFYALAHLADAIMPAHIKIPAYSNKPATISKEMLEGHLRRVMDFQGVLITDSMVMRGITTQCSSIDQAVLEAIRAGNDLIILGGKQLIGSSNGLELKIDDVLRIHQFIVHAVEKGDLELGRIQEAWQRVQSLKERIGERKNPNFKEHEALARKIAASTVEVAIRGSAIPKDEIIHLYYPHSIASAINMLFLPKNIIAKPHEEADSDTPAIFITYNAWKSTDQMDLLHTLKRPLAVIASRDPCDLDLIKLPISQVALFSPDPYSIQRALEVLLHVERI